MKAVFYITATLWIGLASFATVGMERLTPTGFLNLKVQHQIFEIAFYESGGALGNGVLLLHGNTSSAASYAKVLEQPYAKSHRLVAIDLPGYGKSSDANTYNGALLAETIAEAATALGLDGGVIVGSSLGGHLALQASGLLPDIQGYFLFGAAPARATDFPAQFLTPEKSYAGAAVTYGFIRDLTKAQITDYVNAFFRPTFPSSRIAHRFYTDGFRTDPDTRAAVFDAVTGADPTFKDEIEIVTKFGFKPIVLAVGDTDAFLNQGYLTNLAPSLPRLFEGEIHVFQDTGHAVHWERPREFIQLLQRFIDSLPY